MQNTAVVYVLDGRQLGPRDLEETLSRMRRLAYNVRPALPGEIVRQPKPMAKTQKS